MKKFFNIGIENLCDNNSNLLQLDIRKDQIIDMVISFNLLHFGKIDQISFIDNNRLVIRKDQDRLIYKFNNQNIELHRVNQDLVFSLLLDHIENIQSYDHVDFEMDLLDKSYDVVVKIV